MVLAAPHKRCALRDLDMERIRPEYRGGEIRDMV